LTLLGRSREREALDRLLRAARSGRGGVLVVQGEPGVGKTALLEDTAKTAQQFRVLRTAGAEAEQEFPYAALHRFCGPTLDRIDQLPAPQRDALAVAFGMAAGPAPNQFVVALAVLGLLSSLATDQPVLGLVDDAHWLDRGSSLALAFVARRLVAERIGLVFATRDVGESLARLPELRVGPLGHRDAMALLESVLRAPLDEQVMERLIVEASGNPLALIELPRGLTTAELAGGFGLPATATLDARIEESFGRRVAALPRAVRTLILIAASDPTGDPLLVWRAAAMLGIPRSAAVAAESTGLIAFQPHVAFRHPLVRSSVYRAAGQDERTDVHRALADATDPHVDPDRRAWHLGQTAIAPDEDVAADLEQMAARAQARGGLAAAAAFLERSAALTVSPSLRAGRALVAASAKYEAAAVDDAVALLDMAEGDHLDEFQRAEAEVLRARVAFATNRGSDAPPLLLAAARRLEPLDVALARETYLDALGAALFSGRLSTIDPRQVARAALAAPKALEPRPVDMLLDGLAARVADGPATGTARLREALGVYARQDSAPVEALRWRWLAGRLAGFVWDYSAWDILTAEHVRVARDKGMLAELPLALISRVGVHLLSGEMEAATALVEEAEMLARATSNAAPPAYGAIALAAYRGNDDELTALVASASRDFRARGEGMGLTALSWATAAVCNALGRYDDAFGAATEGATGAGETWYAALAVVELIEAASRTGRPERAAQAVESLSESTRASDTPWARGVEARSRALLADGETAESLYRDAIESFELTALRVDLARTHLLYGEWLRREGRRVDARAELRTAHELFSEFGMEGFAERARVELEATGERVRNRAVRSVDQLTSQESQVAGLAAEGYTNRQIAEHLFISPKTVEYHLKKAYRKLDVTSRTQLARRLAQGARPLSTRVAS
jgi:DNA-binding CsgD family transcriptional regulator/alkylated DNA nucleotide flippase Atl1